MDRQEQTIEILREHGIQPSAQRVAVGSFVLHTDAHPSADVVFRRVRSSFPMVSRATVYNTLHLLVEKKLLQEVHLTEGSVVYDPHVETHHHFIDDDTGKIHDVPWEAIQVCNLEDLDGYDIRDYQVVIHGKKRRSRKAR